jgi:hypothetical protein
MIPAPRSRTAFATISQEGNCREDWTDLGASSGEEPDNSGLGIWLQAAYPNSHQQAKRTEK